MITKILKLSIVKYFIFSCLASIVDLGVSIFLYKVSKINYLSACNTGILSGLMFQYFTSMKYVFKGKDSIKSFIVYIVTFFIGLILANGTVWLSYEVVHFSFYISKILSMAVPFFVMYSIRKKTLGLKSNNKKECKSEDILQI